MVKGSKFERRVRKLARSRKVSCQFVADKGKGSQGRLYLGDEFTTLKDRKKEIGRDWPRLAGQDVRGSGRSIRVNSRRRTDDLV